MGVQHYMCRLTPVTHTALPLFPALHAFWTGVSISMAPVPLLPTPPLSAVPSGECAALPAKAHPGPSHRDLTCHCHEPCRPQSPMRECEYPCYRATPSVLREQSILSCFPKELLVDAFVVLGNGCNLAICQCLLRQHHTRPANILLYSLRGGSH